MGLTSRRKRLLRKEIPHLRDASLIIIASEGEITEKVYFESDLFSSNIEVSFLNKDGKEFCIIRVKRGREPLYTKCLPRTSYRRGHQVHKRSIFVDYSD